MKGVSLRKIGRAAVTLALIASVGFAVLMAVPGVFGAEGSYVVRSGSMAPAIQPGDVVVVNSVDAAKIEQGDVITFRRDGISNSDGATERVTHRVVAVNETGEGLRLYTKGDANEERDRQPVSPSQIIGQVGFQIPFIGWIVAFADSAVGKALLLVVPGSLLVLSEVYSLLVATSDEE